mmetsp:Transcript_18875/g.36472  ORF Transcript_18875/g.36472 Transcript_18875/m.36472 type:complete len:252 (-) Transcript_18875:229-984(-)
MQQGLRVDEQSRQVLRGAPRERLQDSRQARPQEPGRPVPAAARVPLPCQHVRFQRPSRDTGADHRHDEEPAGVHCADRIDADAADGSTGGLRSRRQRRRGARQLRGENEPDHSAQGAAAHGANGWHGGHGGHGPVASWSPRSVRSAECKSLCEAEGSGGTSAGGTASPSYDNGHGWHGWCAYTYAHARKCHGRGCRCQGRCRLTRVGTVPGSPEEDDVGEDNEHEDRSVVREQDAWAKDRIGQDDVFNGRE